MTTPARPQPTSGWRGRTGLDVTTVFTGYVVFLFAIPATMIVMALGTLGAPATILSLLAAVWYLFHHLQRGHEVPHGGSPVRQAGIGFLIAMLVVYGHAMTTFIPGMEITNADSNLLRIIGITTLMLVANDGIDSTERWHIMLQRLAMAGAVISLLAAAQFFTHQLWIDRITIPGLTPPKTDGVGTRGQFTRPSATATNAIEFGSVLSMFLPIGFTWAQTAAKRKPLAWACVGLMGFAALISLSRTAIICVVIGLAVLVPAWTRKEKIGLAVIAPFAVVGAGVAVPGLLGTLRGLFLGAGQDSSVASRTASYDVAFSYVARHPFLGRGLGSFLPRYWILDNAYLQLLIGAGIVGIIALLCVIVSAVRSALAAEKIFAATAASTGGGREDALMARSLAASVLAGSVSLIFFDGLSFPQSAGCLMLVLGLAGASLRLARVASTRDTFLDN